MPQTYPDYVGLNGDRKLINAVKKAGMETINPQGMYNGFGYEKLPLHAVLRSSQDRRKFNKVLKNIEGEPAKPQKTEEQKVSEWVKRLCKLTGISESEAEEIAKEKLAYKYGQIYEMQIRQSEQYSAKRQTLINKMERENPLRRIKDKGHADAIIAAAKRHNETNYEDALDYARTLAAEGEIDRSEVKEWARSNFS